MHETKKKEKNRIYETTAQDTGDQAPKDSDPERWETNQVSASLLPEEWTQATDRAQGPPSREEGG